jgi:hypothetical protein
MYYSAEQARVKEEKKNAKNASASTSRSSNDLSESIKPSHQNRVQLYPLCPPHLLLWPLPQPSRSEPRSPMRSYHGLDAGLASGSLFVVRLLNTPTVIIDTIFSVPPINISISFPLYFRS